MYKSKSTGLAARLFRYLLRMIRGAFSPPPLFSVRWWRRGAILSPVRGADLWCSTNPTCWGTTSEKYRGGEWLPYYYSELGKAYTNKRTKTLRVSE